jgi:hypothetical protein
MLHHAIQWSASGIYSRLQLHRGIPTMREPVAERSENSELPRARLAQHPAYAAAQLGAYIWKDGPFYFGEFCSGARGIEILVLGIALLTSYLVYK